MTIRKISRSLPLLLLVLSSQVPGQSRIEMRFANRVSEKRLLNDVRTLVSCGNRLGGTASGDRAAAYVEGVFRSEHITTSVVVDPEKLVYTNDRWSLAIQQPKRLRGLLKNSALAGFSPSTPTQSVQVVFLTPDDRIRKRDIDSSAVLFEGELTDDICEDLADAGARAVLLYHPLPSLAYTQWSMITTLRARRDNPIPVFDVPTIDGLRLKEEIEKGTTLRLRFSARTTIRMGHPKTVVASIPGSSGRYVLVCAHGDSDSGGPGADDNASGAAGVMELARLFRGMIRDGIVPKPVVGLRFAVWGSEYHSSEHFARMHEKELDSIAAVINFDEIGFGRTRNCVYVEGNDVAGNRPLMRVFQSVLETYARKPGFWREGTTNCSQGGTDSYVFLPNGLDHLNLPEAKIPSVTVYCAAWNTLRSLPQPEEWATRAWRGPRDSVIVDYSPYYHSTMDIPRLTTDKEPFNMVWAVKAVGITILRTAWERSH